MSTRKIQVVIACAAIFTLSFSITGLVLGAAGGSPEGSGELLSDTHASESGPSAEPGGYILRDYDGFIAVYQEGFGETPSLITDIPISGLRNTDREMIVEGIHAQTRDEMLKLLEDFGS